MKKLMQALFICGLIGHTTVTIAIITKENEAAFEREADAEDKTGFRKEVLKPLDDIIIKMTQENSQSSLRELESAKRNNKDAATLKKLEEEALGRTMLANAVKAIPRWFSVGNINAWHFDDDAYKASLEEINRYKKIDPNADIKFIAWDIAQNSTTDTPIISNAFSYEPSEDSRQAEVAFNVLYANYLNNHPEVEEKLVKSRKQGYFNQPKTSFLGTFLSRNASTYKTYNHTFKFQDSYDISNFYFAPGEFGWGANDPLYQAKKDAIGTVKNIVEPSMFQRFVNSIKGLFGQGSSSMTRFSADYESAPKKSYFNWPNVRQYAPVMPTREKMIARAAKARAMQYNPAPASASKALKQQERFGIGYQ